MQMVVTPAREARSWGAAPRGAAQAINGAPGAAALDVREVGLRCEDRKVEKWPRKTPVGREPPQHSLQRPAHPVTLHGSGPVSTTLHGSHRALRCQHAENAGLLPHNAQEAVALLGHPHAGLLGVRASSLPTFGGEHPRSPFRLHTKDPGTSESRPMPLTGPQMACIPRAGCVFRWLGPSYASWSEAGQRTRAQALLRERSSSRPASPPLVLLGTACGPEQTMMKFRRPGRAVSSSRVSTGTARVRVAHRCNTCRRYHRGGAGRAVSSEHTPSRKMGARTAGHEGRRGGHVAERDRRYNGADHGYALVGSGGRGHMLFVFPSSSECAGDRS